MKTPPENVPHKFELPLSRHATREPLEDAVREMMLLQPLNNLGQLTRPISKEATPSAPPIQPM